jgi:hypothetical protein
MNARVKTMLAREEAYRQILKNCRKVADVMTVQEHLTQIRTEIESIQAQLKSLKEQSAYSTLSVQLSQSALTAIETKDKGWLGETWANAFTALKDGLKGIAQFLIWILTLSPFWAIPLLLIWWLARLASRKSRRPSPPTPPSSDHTDSPPFVS